MAMFEHPDGGISQVNDFVRVYKLIAIVLDFVRAIDLFTIRDMITWRNDSPTPLPPFHMALLVESSSWFELNPFLSYFRFVNTTRAPNAQENRKNTTETEPGENRKSSSHSLAILHDRG